MEKLSREAESLIINAVSKVSDYVSAGDEPDDAMIKAAGELNLQPGYIQLAAQAYNIGATNENRKSAKSVLDKSASFKLVDPRRVISELYPAQVKTAFDEVHGDAVAAEYSQAPAWVERRARLKLAHSVVDFNMTEKKASCYDREPDFEVRKEIAAQELAKRAAEAKRADWCAAYDKLMGATNDIRLFFKRSSHVSKFADFKANCLLKHGAAVTPLFARLEETNPEFVKMAKPSKTLPPASGRPYELVREWLGLASAFNKEGASYKEAAQEYENKNIIKKACVKAHRPPCVLNDVVELESLEAKAEKAAESHCPPPAGKGVLKPKPPSKPAPAKKPTPPSTLKKSNTPWMYRSKQFLDSVGPLWSGKGEGGGGDFNVSKLQPDPGTQRQIEGLRSYAVLQDLMLNDEVISGYDPIEVTNAYNEIRNFAPAVAAQPVAARAFLRRYLAQGQIDPFDLDLTAGLENKVRKRDEQHQSVMGTRSRGMSGD